MAADGRTWAGWLWDSLTILPGLLVGATVEVVQSWSVWFAGIVSFLAGSAAAVFWTLVGRHLVCWLQWAFCWVLRAILAFFCVSVKPVLALLPSMPSVDLSAYGIPNLWRVVNHWFPLNEFVSAAAIAFLVVLSFRVFRFLKQFVPGLSS